MSSIQSTLPKAFAVRFKNLDRWNVSYFKVGQWHWPAETIRPLKSFTRAEVISISLENAKAQALPIISKINFSGELFLRSMDDYEDYRGRLFVANPNRIIFSKINARQGCIFYVPEQHAPFAVSAEYPILRLDESLANGLYVDLALRVGPAREQLLGGASGMAKARTNIEDFQNIRIPLPPLPTQQAIVEYWQKSQAEIAAARARIEEHKARIDARFLEELGLKVPQRREPPKYFGMHWKDFSRWSVSYSQAALTGTDLSKGRYPVVSLGSILEFVQYGTSEKANTTEKGTPILRINNIKEKCIDYKDLKHIDLPGNVVSSLTLQDGDILIIRTSGSRDLVGTCAVFHGEEDFVFASYLIRLRPAVKKADADFVSWFINSALGRSQVNAISRHIMQNNINTVEIKSIQTPLPPLEVQKQIMKHVEDGRAAIAAEQKQIGEQSRRAVADLEALILGTKSIEELTSV
jgi:restriction endonuclease S subunit